nr:transcriptional regulatory protein [uncultured bacterium]
MWVTGDMKTLPGRLEERSVTVIDRPDPPLRNRDAQLARIEAVLRPVGATGKSAVLLAEGPAGSGKSRLVAEAARLGADQGYTVLRGAASRLTQQIPMAPLLAALAVPAPAPEPNSTDVLDRQLGVVGRLEVRLRERLRTGPVLVALDDLQWADPATLLALRMLCSRLAGAPVVWLLVLLGGDRSQELDLLFDALRGRAHTERLDPLAPLCDRASVQLVTDVLGAPPGPEISELVESTNGNPRVVIDLVTGMRDDGAIRVVDGVARLAAVPAIGLAAGAADRRSPGPLPARFRALIGAELAALSPATRQMVQVAAVLGVSFSPDDLCEMLGEPPSRLLPVMQEALHSELMFSRLDDFAFRREPVWRAVLDTVPMPVRVAMHRQAADMLLRREGGIMAAATHLVHGALPGDALAVDLLGRAAEQVLTTSPRTAVTLASRGLELSEPQQPGYLQLAVTAVRALNHAGPLDRAAHVATEVLDEVRPEGEAGARLRQLLSTTLLLQGQAGRGSGLARQILADPRLGPELRDGAEVVQLVALSHTDERAAYQRADAVLAERSGRGAAVAAIALTVRAVGQWREGRVGDALRTVDEAGSLLGDGTDTWHSDPRWTGALMRLRLRKLAEATDMITACTTAAEERGADVVAAVPAILRSGVHLARGELAEAEAAARAGVSAGADHHMPLFAPLAWAVLTTTALRGGDLMAAGEHVRELDRTVLDQSSRPWWALRIWVAARVAGARDGAAAAMGVLVEGYRDAGARRELLLEDYAAAAWCVRAALEAGLPDIAHALAETAHALEVQNPELPALGVAAAHARGLIERDGQALALAAERHDDPWARASAAEDLAVLLRAADPEAAIAQLDTAMAGYDQLGAKWDAARARRRLRALGVRRRHWNYADRPVGGRASLTQMEETVAALVVQGLTNRQVASQLFVSPHTVGFHLRQIFRKLGIHSRIDLVRRIS